MFRLSSFVIAKQVLLLDSLEKLPLQRSHLHFFLLTEAADGRGLPSHAGLVIRNLLQGIMMLLLRMPYLLLDSSMHAPMYSPM